jgi:tetratricopeptide (TPR) repeat protein
VRCCSASNSRVQAASGPIMIGHRLVASSLALTGDLVKGIAHYDKALAFYDPAKHRALTTRFGQDVGVVVLSLRAFALWLLGYPDHARADIEGALANAREIGHAATLMYALTNAASLHIELGNFPEANSFDNHLAVLAEQTDAPFWTAVGIGHRGCIFSLTGNPSAAVDAITSAVTVWRSTGATIWMTMYLVYLARAYAWNNQFEDAWRCAREAVTSIKTTGLSVQRRDRLTAVDRFNDARTQRSARRPRRAASREPSRRNSSGSLAMLAAMRRASSRVGLRHTLLGLHPRVSSLEQTYLCAVTHSAVFRTVGTGRMPERVDQYRLNADKCLELAETFKDPDANVPCSR